MSKRKEWREKVTDLYQEWYEDLPLMKRMTEMSSGRESFLEFERDYYLQRLIELDERP